MIAEYKLAKRPRFQGFTLIELLIVIAIILILIAIALPNFLAAQARARVSRERADQRTIATAIEAMRADLGFLLVDFWDDDRISILNARFYGRPAPGGEPARFAACCYWHNTNRRGGSTGLYTPLTTPLSYLTSVPTDPFAHGRGGTALIDEDVIPPISYLYHDWELADWRLLNLNPDPAEHYRGVFGCHMPESNCPPGQDGVPKPLPADQFILVGFGPDGERNDNAALPYAPTNGVKSNGDVVYRSDLGPL